MKQEYRPTDVANIFNVSRMAVNNWVRDGKLPVYETGGGHYRIARTDLIKFIKNTGKPLPKELESDNYRVLIVDDEQFIHTLVKKILKGIKAELEVESAFNCFEAGMKVTEFLPHLVILDAKMPKCNGDMIVKLIRGNENLKHIKILVFTGDPDEGQKLVKLGADKVIDKGSEGAKPEGFRKEVGRMLGI